MAKLTQKQRAELSRAADHLQRALAYVNRPSVALCIRRDIATTTLDYSRADGAVVTEICKDIGSEFAMASTALHEILSFLNTN